MPNIITTNSLIRQVKPTNTDNPGNDARLVFYSEDENAPCFKMSAVLNNCCTWSKDDNDKWQVKFNEDLPPIISYNKDGSWILHPFTIEFDKNDTCWKIIDIRFADGTSIFKRQTEINDMFKALKGGVR